MRRAGVRDWLTPCGWAPCWSSVGLRVRVKQQFEAGLAHVGKGGIVRSEAVHRAVLTQVHGFAQDAGWQVHASFESTLSGGDGNREYFMQASL